MVVGGSGGMGIPLSIAWVTLYYILLFLLYFFTVLLLLKYSVFAGKILLYEKSVLQYSYSQQIK